MDAELLGKAVVVEPGVGLDKMRVSPPVGLAVGDVEVGGLEEGVVHGNAEGFLIGEVGRK